MCWLSSSITLCLCVAASYCRQVESRHGRVNSNQLSDETRALDDSNILVRAILNQQNRVKGGNRLWNKHNRLPVSDLLSNVRDVGVEPLLPLLVNRDVGHRTHGVSDDRSDDVYRVLKNNLQKILQRNVQSLGDNVPDDGALGRVASLLNLNDDDRDSREDLLDKIDAITNKNNADLIVLPEELDRVCNRYLKSSQVSYAPLNIIQKHVTDMNLPPQLVEKLCNAYLFRDNSDDYNNDLRKFINIGDDSSRVIPDKYWKKGYGDQSVEVVPVQIKGLSSLNGNHAQCPYCVRIAQFIREHSKAGHPVDGFNDYTRNVNDNYSGKRYKLRNDNAVASLFRPVASSFFPDN